MVAGAPETTPLPLVDRYFVVPHTHWDREWYRPLEHFRLMLGGVVDEVLDTLERDPAFSSFTLDGQAIVLEDYVVVRPGNESRLRALIEAGRIEIGPSYVLPDELLVGGEALVRNLLIGRSVCERFGGRASAAGYLPDSFGHPMQLPQILAGFGIDTILFSRGLGDEIDEIGVAFNWVAPDGSEVLALQLLGDYSNFAAIQGADDAEARVRGVLERFGPLVERAGTSEVVLCNGTDHHPIQPEMPAVCAELEQRFPGTTFTIAKFGDYVSELRTGSLPSWSGELLGSRLWNVLRGVNSARLYLKQANETAEQRLLSVEALAALGALSGGTPFPHADFEVAWRELLACHPHDSICGCSCDEVHRDMLARYASLDRTLAMLVVGALAPLPSEPGAEGIGVFNPLPFARTGLLKLPGAEPTLVELAGFETKTVELAPAAARNRAPRNASHIESDRFRVEVAADGTLAIDDLARGRRFAGLHALEDEFDMGDLYNFCPVDGIGVRTFAATGTRILADGPLAHELEITYEALLPAGLDEPAETVVLSLTTIVRLVRGSDRIEFETTIDNPAKDHRLRVVFPSGGDPPAEGPVWAEGQFAERPVRAEGQFAIVHRPLVPPVPRTDWCEPPDATQHTSGAVALGAIAVVTRGLPEYEARPGTGDGGSDLCLTMLRCVGLISRATDEIATRPLGAGPRMPTPEGQCLGRHVLEYALRLDADELDDVALARESLDYRREFLVVPRPAEFAPPLKLAGDVVFSALKGAEDGDGLILRVFNPGAQAATASVGAGEGGVERVRLDETRGSPVADGTVEVRPGEIVTLRVRQPRAG
jgi:alpha-mannosidase